MLPPPDWLGERLLSRPVQNAHAMPKRAKADASFIGPLAKRLSLAFKLQIDVARVVQVLLATFNPARVFGRVWAVIVAAIDRQPRQRLRVIVFDEQADIVPSFADDDAASTVAREGLGCGLVAAVHHAGPCAEEPMLAQPVLQSTRRGQLSREAAARLAVSALHSEAGDRSFSAAIASAVIERVTAFCGPIAAKNKPAPEALAANIFGKTTTRHRAKHSTISVRYPLSPPRYAEGIA